MKSGETRHAGQRAQIRRGMAALILLIVPLLAASRAPHAVHSVFRFVHDHSLPRATPTPPHEADIVTSSGRVLRAETVARNLDTPWDLAWGPDGVIWFTERPGRVSRLDLATGSVSRAGEIEVVEQSESGLMGMAFHPDFATQPHVYFAHSYRGGTGIRNKLIRMTWRDGRLQYPETLLDDIPGRGNHNGSRLVVGPDGMLYMTMGDAGAREAAQDRNSLSGKILRLTLDGRPAPGNPYGNYTWSYGHRNPQGIAFMPASGMLYSSEHGPSEADEVNRIERGRNYGWPAINGLCDSPQEQTFCEQNNVVPSMVEYTPTIGVSGLDVYDSDRVPGWRGSLLLTSLRGQRFIRIMLSNDGRSATGQEDILRGEYGRLRDVLVAPDGAIYIATSNHDGRGRPTADDDRIIRIRP